MADGSDATDGWWGVFPDDLRFLRDVPPPRRGSYWRQLRYNLRRFLPWALLAPGTVALAVGLWKGWSPLAGTGAVWLAGYFYLSWTAAAILRNGRLQSGMIWPQPALAAEQATEVEVVLPGGQSVRASFSARSTIDLVAHLVAQHGVAEVLLLCHPTGDTSLLIGARAPAQQEKGSGVFV